MLYGCLRNTGTAIFDATIQKIVVVLAIFFFGQFLALFLKPANAFANEEEITLASRVDLPPYTERGATGGIEVDLVTAILAEGGFRAKFIQFPINRMVLSFVNQRTDGLLLQLQDVKTGGCVTDVYFEHANVAVTLKEAGLTLARIEDLSNYAVLSFEGATRFMRPAFKTAVEKSPHYVEVAFQETHLDLLYQGRFDTVVGDEWILRHSLKVLFDETGDYREIVSHPIMEPLKYVAHFHKDFHCKAFNDGLTALRATGRYDAILKAHYERIMEIPGLEKR